MKGNWIIENYDGQDEQLSQGAGELSHKVSVNVFGCKNMNLTLTGKAKTLMLEGCKNLTIFVDSIVAHVECLNCDTIKVYAQKQLPLCNFENTSELKLFLTNATRNCLIVTSGSRTINVKFPKEGADDNSEENEDFITMVLPESFETKVVAGNKIHTE